MSQNDGLSSPWLNPAILVRFASFVENSTNPSPASICWTDDAPALQPQPGPRVRAPPDTWTSTALFQKALAPSAARASPALAMVLPSASAARSAPLQSRLMMRPSSRGPRRARRRGMAQGTGWIC
ncbi:hypothetical protein [Sorangium sp. So ce363]|uniref:hypothetical protein n=1 Tax=Sorangium sp. So ce363 TaxID=3133304 RepID=UPI003F636D0A